MSKSSRVAAGSAPARTDYWQHLPGRRPKGYGTGPYRRSMLATTPYRLRKHRRR